VVVTVEGELDGPSQYLLNIVQIDAAVRELALPVLRERGLKVGVVRELAREITCGLKPAFLTKIELHRTPYLVWGFETKEPEMVRVSQLFEFSAAHRLHNPALSDEENVRTFGKCNNPLGHGHNYQVQVTVKGSEDELQSLTGKLERIVDETVIRPFDHKHLNLQVPEFSEMGGVIPSVENIAKVAYGKLKPVLGERLTSVTVWETPKTWAEYWE
jgi:6-pyruvoyltetrahydropterin/6-carboxytetrahydropterin synthase